VSHMQMNDMHLCTFQMHMGTAQVKTDGCHLRWPNCGAELFLFVDTTTAINREALGGRWEG